MLGRRIARLHCVGAHVFYIVGAHVFAKRGQATEKQRLTRLELAGLLRGVLGGGSLQLRGTRPGRHQPVEAPAPLSDNDHSQADSEGETRILKGD